MKLKYLKSVLKAIMIIAVCAVVISCTSTRKTGGIVVQTGDAVPRKEAYTKGANPNSYVVRGKKYHVKKTHHGYRERGTASWYGKQFHGRKTANAEKYDMYKMTAAHKSLPIPSYVKVTNLENKKTVIVRVNDRGPFHSNRIIDLSYAAAKKIGMHNKGTARVEVEAISVGEMPIRLAENNTTLSDARPNLTQSAKKSSTKKASSSKSTSQQAAVKKSNGKLAASKKTSASSQKVAKKPAGKSSKGKTQASTNQKKAVIRTASN